MAYSQDQNRVVATAPSSVWYDGFTAGSDPSGNAGPRQYSVDISASPEETVRRLDFDGNLGHPSDRCWRVVRRVHLSLYFPRLGLGWI